MALGTYREEKCVCKMSQIKHVLDCIANIKELGSVPKTLLATNHCLSFPRFGGGLSALEVTINLLLKMRSGLASL